MKLYHLEGEDNMGLIGALITGAVSIISTVVSTIGPTIASATSALITTWQH